MASDGTRPHERLTGLVALLHPASSTQIRNLTVGSVDQRNRALAQLGRPLTVAADLLREAKLGAGLEAGEAGQPEFWVRTDVVP
jgi:hypothetical protein